MSQSSAVEKLSFEDALSELEGIVKSLETGQAKLEDSIGFYERGVALRLHCERKLRDAQSKIEKITIGSGGKIALEPLDKSE
jgi:exodeoxyribonuclease VII small subunit